MLHTPKWFRRATTGLVAAVLGATLVSAASAQLLLNEDFNYLNGSPLIGQGGWVITGATVTNPLTVTSPTLSYPSYVASGVGNSVLMVNTGQDASVSFTSQTTGAVYASALVNVVTAETTGDYFMHVNPSVGSTFFPGRVFIQKDPSSTNFAFGIRFASAGTIAYTPFAYTPGTTYLIVLKYAFVAGATNDVVSLFVNPTIGAAEPAPTVSHTTPSGADATNIDRVNLRQGGGAGVAPSVRVDGIRVGQTWFDVLPAAPQYRSVASGNWGSASTWEQSTNLGATWVPAVGTPTSAEGVVTVRTGHTVTVAASVAADELTIEAGANVTVASGQTLTIDDGTGTDALVDGTLETAGTITNNGQVSMGGGRLQIDEGGWPGNTGTYSYDPTGELAFNATGFYGVNSDATWWPSSNGPQNVLVLQGGLTMNIVRTVGTSLRTSGGVSYSTGNVLSLGGLIQLNPGGYFPDPPDYLPGSTLEYNTGGGYGIYNEWMGGTTQPGVPQNLHIVNSQVTFDSNRSGTSMSVLGNVTIDAAGSLTLGSSPGGDLSVGGNWTNNGGFSPNGRAVTFNGSSAQSITGATTFDYLTLNNAAGLSLNNNATVNQTLAFTSGKISTGANTLSIGSGGGVTGAGASSYVYGKLHKVVVISGSAGSQTYEVGDAAIYAPVLYATTTGASDIGLTASTTAGDVCARERAQEVRQKGARKRFQFSKR